MAGCWLGLPWPDHGAARGISAGLSGHRLSGGRNAGNWEPQPASNIRVVQPPGPAWGRRPLAWRRLVPSGSGGAQRALLPERERSPGQATPRVHPPRRGIQLTEPSSPCETPLMVVPGERCAGPLQRAACAGCWVPSSRSALLLPSPALRLRREERPRAPRMGRNCAACPREVAQGGLPKVTRIARAERPDRPERRAGRRRRWLRLLPWCRLPPSRLLLPRSGPSFTGDAGDAAPSRGRITEPPRALSLALPGTSGAERERHGCLSASQNRKPSCLRAHVIGFHIMGPCSRCQKRPPAPRGPGHQVPPLNRPLWRTRALRYQAPLPAGISREGACG